MENKIECPVCHKLTGELFADGKDFFILDGNSPDFGIGFCGECGIGYSFPVLGDSELARYYPDDYEAYIPKKSLKNFLQGFKYRSDLRKIRRNIAGRENSRPSMFEIGAGRGEFLAEAEKAGFLVSGIEPGKAGVEFAEKNFGVKLRNAYASGMSFSEKYDVIVMRHTLEHINGFQECLKTIYEGLKPGGYLFLKLPRLDSWEAGFFGKFWRGFDLPRHRTHFSKMGIEGLLKNAGFCGIEISGEVVPVDIIGSIGYYSRHGASGLRKLLSSVLSFLPEIVSLPLCQLWGLVLSPFGTGRMIVFARRPNDGR